MKMNALVFDSLLFPCEIWRSDGNSSLNGVCHGFYMGLVEGVLLLWVSARGVVTYPLPEGRQGD